MNKKELINNIALAKQNEAYNRKQMEYHAEEVKILQQQAKALGMTSLLKKKRGPSSI